MKKDAFYFPHFSNARHDRKLKRVVKDLGVEGYGIYFMLLEVLRDQIDFKYPVKDVDLLADEFNVSEAKISTIITRYDLFVVDETNNFFSIKQIQYLQPYIEKTERARAAALKRWSDANVYANADANAQANEVQQQSISNASKGEESKEKKNKVKDIEERKLEFKELLRNYTQKYSVDVLKSFFEYWTESNTSKTKMRFEDEKFFDVGRRLSTWAKKEKNFAPKKENAVDAKFNQHLESHEGAKKLLGID